jgi:FSR family fosmidomycin resistance protein-like MFS transporter
MKRVAIGLLSAGHLVTDFAQGAVPAFVPFLVLVRHWTLPMAGTFVFAMTIASSLLQPLFGHWADRRPLHWMIPGGFLAAAVGVALIGWLPGYSATIAVLGVAGIGVAAFHPPAARAMHRIEPKRRATAMSIFALGGNAGFALGPLAATGALALLGLRGSALLCVPAVMLAIAYIIMWRSLKEAAPEPAHASGGAALSVSSPGVNEWARFGILSSAVFCRSVAFFALDSFLALYWIQNLHQRNGLGSAALSLFLAAGACGTLLGGWAADRYGRKRVVTMAFLIAAALNLAVPFAPTPLIATLLLIPMGMALFAPFSVMVTMGQAYLPGHIGLASGVTFGLAVTVGGVAAPLYGWLAERHGLVSIFWMTGAVLALGWLCSLLLEADSQQRAQPAAGGPLAAELSA